MLDCRAAPVKGRPGSAYEFGLNVSLLVVAVGESSAESPLRSGLAVQALPPWVTRPGLSDALDTHATRVRC
jgi:hypothetical protein